MLNDFTPVDPNCAVLFKEGQVTSVIATGLDVTLYEIDCAECEHKVTLVLKGDDVPLCCPMCGNEIEDDDEDADEAASD